MKQLLFFLVFFLFLVFPSFAQTNPKHVHVNGYYRKDGTYVQPHYRTAPNSTNRDNFSTVGNTNPYTGQPGYVPADPQLNTSTYNSKTSNDDFFENKIKERLNRSTFYESYPSYTTIRQSNLREQMDTSSAIVTVIPKGGEVKVVNSFFGDWWQIYYDGKAGYVHSSLLKFYSSGNESTYSSFYDEKPTYLTKGVANLREQMSTSSAILEIISAGSEVKIVSSFFGDWWQIYYNGKTGYIHNSLLKRK